MQNFPYEQSLGDVYFSPFLVVLVLAFIATSITSILLNKLKLSQFIIYPPLSFVAIMVLYVILIDKYLIKF